MACVHVHFDGYGNISVTIRAASMKSLLRMLGDNNMLHIDLGDRGEIEDVAVVKRQEEEEFMTDHEPYGDHTEDLHRDPWSVTFVGIKDGEWPH